LFFGKWLPVVKYDAKRGGSSAPGAIAHLFLKSVTSAAREAHSDALDAGSD
jgi:hypothetical protein